MLHRVGATKIMTELRSSSNLNSFKLDRRWCNGALNRKYTSKVDIIANQNSDLGLETYFVTAAQSTFFSNENSTVPFNMGHIFIFNYVSYECITATIM